MMYVKKLCILMILLIVILVPAASQDRETLAVLDFTTEAVSRTEMTAIVEFLSAELFNTEKYIVIDVSQRETILSEMEFSNQGCTDESCALEIGKLLSAELIVVGNLSKVGSRYLMSVKMLQTETSRTMGTANGKFSNLDELIDGLEDIAFELARIERKTSDETEVVSEPEPEIKEKPETAAEPPEIKADQEIDKTASAADGDTTGLAIGLTAAGGVALAVGGVFLAAFFPESLKSYQDADAAYDAAETGADFNVLWQETLDTYRVMTTNFWIGAGTAAGGAVLLTIGLLLFPPPENDDLVFNIGPAVGPDPGIIVRVSY